MAKLLSFPQAELLPIAVNAGPTPKPKPPNPETQNPDDVVPLSDRLGEALREAWFERIIDQLLSAEKGERNPQWRGDYRQARVIIGLCRKDDPEPLVSSSYAMYGVHPELVFVAIQSIRKAKLGDEYSDFYDENGNLLPQRLDIPDYDPTLAMHRRRWAPPVAPEVWPDVRRLAPLRLIVSREEVKEGGRILYYNEELKCGHVQQEFLGGNLSSKRRRCRQCL